MTIKDELPPKPEARVLVPMSEAHYAVLLAEDARRIRSKQKNRYGFPSSEAARNDANEERSRQIIEAREALAARILADLTLHPCTRAEIIWRMGETENAIRQAMLRLKERGQIRRVNVSNRWIWEIVG